MNGPNSDRANESVTPLGVYGAPAHASRPTAFYLAGGISVLWLVLIYLLYRANADSFAAQGADTALRVVTGVMVLVLPLAMIWVVAAVVRANQVLRLESERNQAAIDSLRQAYLIQQQRPSNADGPDVARKLDEIAQKTDNVLATFTSTRSKPAPVVTPAPAKDDGQSTLALGTPAEDLAEPISNADFVRALNFPETPEDQEGFAALRKALASRKSAQLVQASQDVLTLLSQDGIYMDDLRPDVARPDIWRDFANGTRGDAVAALGGIRDRSSLALTAGRMKSDPIFRDAAHHFLRHFDQMIEEFAQDASDSELDALARSRTGRAFMLVGRVAGAFD